MKTWSKPWTEVEPEMHRIHIWHASMHATGPTDGLSSTVVDQRGIAVHHIERHRWVALVLNMWVFRSYSAQMCMFPTIPIYHVGLADVLRTSIYNDIMSEHTFFVWNMSEHTCAFFFITTNAQVTSRTKLKTHVLVASTIVDTLDTTPSARVSWASTIL